MLRPCAKRCFVSVTLLVWCGEEIASHRAGDDGHHSGISLIDDDVYTLKLASPL